MISFILLSMLLSVAGAATVWGSQSLQTFKNVPATIRPPEGDFIRSITSSDGRIFVWGYTGAPYLGSGRVSATRDLNLFYFFYAPPEIKAYYQSRFLEDLRHEPAQLFIDAVGPTSWPMRDRQQYSFEQFPDISSFVYMNYVHLTDAYGQRYFLRRDIAARRSAIALPKSCAIVSLACLDMPARQYTQEASLEMIVSSLKPISLPSHALIEAEFTPMAGQTENSTVFNNEATPGSFKGFRFQSVGGDRYRLILGLGNKWAFSKSILLPPGRRASLIIEVKGTIVYLRCNGVAVDDMHLPWPIADANGPVTVGSWINGFCRFTGTIDFFQIVTLGTTAERDSRR